MAATKARSRSPRSTPQEHAEKQATRVAELKGQFDAAVAQLVTTDSWRTMLDGAIHFHRYSFRNMLLLLSQRPHATQIAGYREWHKRNRHVRPGEHALWILAAMTIRDTDDDAQGSTDQADDDRRRVPYRPVPVWDITQTARNDGKPDALATGAPRLTGDAPAKMWDSLAAHATSLGYLLERGDTGTANGWTDPAARTVRVSSALDDAHAAKTLTHEVAHIQCEHVADMNEYRQHRGRMETEAESVAYIVSAVFRLDSTAYSVPYVAGWAGNTPRRSRRHHQSRRKPSHDRRKDHPRRRHPHRQHRGQPAPVTAPPGGPATRAPGPSPPRRTPMDTTEITHVITPRITLHGAPEQLALTLDPQHAGVPPVAPVPDLCRGG